VELLPFDEKKSRIAAENVLSQYRMKRSIASMPVSPSITSGWGDGTAASTAPRQAYAQQREEDMERARGFCQWVDRCIKALPRARHQRLLQVRYCNGVEQDQPDTIAMLELGVSSTTYFKLKYEALLAVSYFLGVRVPDTGESTRS
jgi:ArpU family phage transcriptional regulator